jgi:hypothetical protein
MSAEEHEDVVRSTADAVEVTTRANGYRGAAGSGDGHPIRIAVA